MQVTPLLAATWGLMVLSGCVAMPLREATIHQSTRGAVHLERVRDPGFVAAHPHTIEESMIRRVLQGVEVQPRLSKVTTFVFGDYDPERAFSDPEVVFLAPLVVRALAQANQHQTIAIEVTEPSPAGPIETGGTLFVRGTTIHFTLTRYRYQPDSGTTVYERGRVAPDSNGLDQRRVLFAPATVLEPDIPPEPGLSGLRHLTTLAIDTHILSKMPESEPARQSEVGGMPNGADPRPPKTDAFAVIERKDREIKALKDEVHQLEQKLQRQQADLLPPTPSPPAGR